jgi:CYTH domain-containing protein
MNIEIGKRYLITTDAWFFAPDGRNYRAVYGTVSGIHSSEEALGVRTNAKSTNWYVQIGRVTIAGCQVHYAIQTDQCELGDIDDFDTTSGEIKRFNRPSVVYFAD